MRPFPQVATGGANLSDQWAEYRKAMIEHAGIALFVFGNKRNGTGDIIPSDGMRREFELCVQAGVRPLPIGATGFMAAELWKEVLGDFARFLPDSNVTFKKDFEKLGDASKPVDELLSIVQNLIENLQKG